MARFWVKTILSGCWKKSAKFDSVNGSSTKDELSTLGRIVNAYLELAEERALRKIPMTMED